MTNDVIGKKKNIQLSMTMPKGIGSARFDRERMHQALDNLISNAFKYSNPGSSVSIGALKDGPDLKIWVEDNGIGINEQELPYIFDEFSKTSSIPTAGETSHGLGLAIAKRVVELHGGSIAVKSSPGEGSIFTVSLPLS